MDSRSGRSEVFPVQMLAGARLAGFEPATRCLEVRFAQGGDLRVPRSEAVRDARGLPLATAVLGSFWHGYGTPAWMQTTGGAPWTSNSPDQHSTDENGAAGQHETDDREQRASKQECIPSASPHDPCEPHDTDDREQRSSAKPPADPPAACEPGAAPISGPTGRGGGGTPHH